jgi:hypothetical protein
MRAGNHPARILRALYVKDCHDFHGPRIYDLDLIADHEVVVSAPSWLDLEDLSRNRDEANRTRQRRAHRKVKVNVVYPGSIAFAHEDLVQPSALFGRDVDREVRTLVGAAP